VGVSEYGRRANLPGRGGVWRCATGRGGDLRGAIRARVVQPGDRALKAGRYDVVVYAHRASTGTFDGAQVVRVTVP